LAAGERCDLSKFSLGLQWLQVKPGGQVMSLLGNQKNKYGKREIMKLETIKQIVGNLPHMRVSQACQMGEFIHQFDIRNVLELGFAYGVSTCYIAAAIDELGGGSVTTIDRDSARRRNPNIEQLLEKCGFHNVTVTYYYEPTSYTWRLMRFLEGDILPQFDLCYIDGAHNWFTDGFSFFLVDRLLKVGGWIIFDDIDWTYATSPSLRETDRVKSMPKDERETPQVQRVYELLVKTHPCYDDFSINNGWAYAHKVSSTITPKSHIRQERIYVRKPVLISIREVIEWIRGAA
jgi:predicted O-methyltransferase YrrM